MGFLKGFAGSVHWLPRLALFGIFAYHGWQKIAAPAGPAEMLGMPTFVVLILGIVEVGGGLLILYGGIGPEWATQLAGLLFSAVMVGAIAMVHAANGWNSIGNGGMEFQVLILATSLYFAAKGSDAN